MAGYGSLGVQGQTYQLLDVMYPLIDQARMLVQKYDVVVTNPPYMGASGMNARLSDYVKKYYPDSKSDLFACFMERADAFAKENRFTSLITMESWMFLSSFEKLREKVNLNKTIVNMVHMPYLGKGGTSLGINFGTAAVVMKKGHIRNYAAQYEYTVYYECDEEGVPLVFPTKNERWKTATQENFSKIPGSPVAYWVSKKIFNLFDKTCIDDYYNSRVGLMTTDNDKFLRFFWEVEKEHVCFTACSREDCEKSGKKWFPHNKGGAYRKWAGNRDYVVDWQNNGEKIKRTAIKKYPYLNGNPNFVVHDDGFYFKENISWSEIGTGNLSFRYYPKGFTFNVKGMSMFPKKNLSLMSVLAFANTKVASYLAHIINPSISFGVNSFGKIPFQPAGENAENLASDNVELSVLDWDSFETSWDFKRHPLV